MNDTGQMYKAKYTVSSGNDTARNIELNPLAISGTAARKVS